MGPASEHPRVLIAAEHASLKFGGEAALPLHYFRVLRGRGVEAWLVVHERTGDELADQFPDDMDRITFIEDTGLHRLLWRCRRLLPARLGYFTFGMLMRLLTQRAQKRVVREAIAKHRIDIVHQPIPVSPREPSMLHTLGVPVVIGPMNGGINYPDAFRHMQNRFVDTMMGIGRLSARILNTVIPGKKQAAILLVANPRTRDALPGGMRGEVIELVENGVDLSVWTRPQATDEQPTDQPIRFVYIGRLVDWKAVDILLEAFAPVGEELGAVLEIIGDGPDRGALEAQARAAGLLDRPNVVFAGWMKQTEAAGRLHQADALVLSSVLECGGAVVLEAMAAGVPAIATNWGGPVDYLNESCGILVDAPSRDQFIANLTAAMLRLGKSPELREQMGEAGRRRIEEHFDWEAKVDRILDIYRQAIDRQQEKP